MPTQQRTPSAPQRTCVGCRKATDQSALVRIAREGGVVVVDRRRRAPGRGAYVHAGGRCIEAALRNGGIVRALRGVAIQDDVAEQLRRELLGNDAGRGSRGNDA